MKQTVIDWYKRNGFNFWKIENSKGKTIADNTAGKSKEDGDASRLTVELEALERLNITERYTVSGMVKNGHDWSAYPFHTSPSAFGMGGGGSNGIMEMAMMFGRMQSDNANQMLIWQLQQEKAERERKEAERMTFGKILESMKPILPMLAPVAVNGLFGLAEKSPAIQNSLATLLANPQVAQVFTNIMVGMAQQQQPQTQDYSNEQGTGIELETD